MAYTPQIANEIRDNLPPADKTARLSIKTELGEVAGFLGQKPPEHPRGPNTWRAEKTLDAVESNLAELNKKVMERLAKLADSQQKTLFTTEWSEYKMSVLNAVDAYHANIANIKKPPNQLTTEDQAKVDKQTKVIDAHIKDVERLIKAVKDGLKDDIGDDDAEISSQQFTMYNSKLVDIKKMIRPALADMYQVLVDLQADVTGKDVEVHQLAGENLSKLDKLYDEQLKILSKAKVNITFNPQVNSTPNNSVLVGGVAGAVSLGAGVPGNPQTSGTLSLANSFNTRNTSYGRHESYPKLKSMGQGRYSAWRDEMMEDVLPNKSRHHQIRVISDQSGHPEIQGMFVDVGPAIAYLDKIYLNHYKVSKDICRKFLLLTRMDGHNKQSRLVNLYQQVTEMQLSLRAMGYESQLTEDIKMLDQMNLLLALKYQEDFADKLGDEEEKKERQLNVKERFEFFYKWLERKHNYIVVNLSHRLKPPRKEDSEDSEYTEAVSEDSEDGCNSRTGSGLSRKERRTLEALKRKEAHGLQGKTGRQPSGAGGGGDDKQKGSSATSGDPTNLTEKKKEYIEAEWDKFGPCPACGAKGHMFEGFKGWGPSKNLSDCPKFVKEMNPDQRAQLIIEKKLCLRCTSHQHNTKDCPKDKTAWFCHVRNKDGKVCGEPHSSYLHGCSSKIILQNHFHARRASEYEEDQEGMYGLTCLQQDAMLPIVTMDLSETVSTLALLDSGATSSLILNSLAKKLKLKARSTLVTFKVTGRPAEMRKMKYYVVKLSLPEQVRTLVLLGVNDITEVPGGYNIDAAYAAFPQYKAPALDKPGGQVGILIGQDNADLLPRGGLGADSNGKLVVWEIPFAPWRVLTGSHPDIAIPNKAPVLTDEAYVAAHFTQIAPAESHQTCVFSTQLAGSPADFCEDEMMNLNAPIMDWVDYNSAVSVYNNIKRRISKRAHSLLFFVLLLCCMSTGGLQFQLATDYSAAEFMTQHQFPESPWDEITSNFTPRLQRLAPSLPVSVQNSLHPADPDPHICDDEMRLPSNLIVPHQTPVPEGEKVLSEKRDGAEQEDPDATAPLPMDSHHCWECQQSQPQLFSSLGRDTQGGPDSVHFFSPFYPFNFCGLSPPTFLSPVGL